MSRELLDIPMELTNDQLDAVSAGNHRTPALVNVSDINVNVEDVAVVVAAQALTNRSGQGILIPQD